jgi:hypothetical protein
MGMDMGNTDGHMEAQLRAWTDERFAAGFSQGGRPDMHTHSTRLEGRLPSAKGASLFGSPARRGTVARQSFAPPRAGGGGRSSSTLPIGASSLP